MVLIWNQIWFHSPVCSKANLLTLGCGKGKCSTVSLPSFIELTL